jgi:hypothetical protein
MQEVYDSFGLHDVGKNYINDINKEKKATNQEGLKLDRVDGDTGKCIDSDDEMKSKADPKKSGIAKKGKLNLRALSNIADHNAGVYDYDGFFDADTYGDHRDNSEREIIGYDENGKPIYADYYGSGRTADQFNKFNKGIEDRIKQNAGPGGAYGGSGRSGE